MSYIGRIHRAIVSYTGRSSPRLLERSSRRRSPRQSPRQSPRVYTTGDRRRDEHMGRSLATGCGDDRPVYTPHYACVSFARWRRARDNYDKKLLEESDIAAVDTVDSRSRQRRHLATGVDNTTTRTTTSTSNNQQQSYISNVSAAGLHQGHAAHTNR